MNIVQALVAWIIGLALIAVFFRSLISTTLFNRHRRDGIGHAITSISWAVFRSVALRSNEQAVIDRRIIWFWPIAVFSLIFTWFGLVVVGFAFFYWATGAATTVFGALVASGSALSTLGFDTVNNPPGQVLAICEAAIGLFIVVYTITFLPGFMIAMQQRNDQVAWVYARTGAPPTAGRLLEWFYGLQPELIDELWSSWEMWFRALGETHAATPLLNMSRSFRPEQDWLAGTAAMLDASALASTTLDIASAPSATVCCDTGIRALRTISMVFATEQQLTGDGLAPTQVDRATFDALCARLAAAGAPIKTDSDLAWREFSEKRLQYEAALAVIAHRILARARTQPLM